MCGLIGRNGAGKTTLLRALMGAIPATGRAELDHIDLLALPSHRRVGHGIGYMPEDRRLVPEFTVEDNIRLPTWTTETDGADERLAWIFTIMPEVAAFRGRRSYELSGGQQKMVALARALMAGRRMLLLDEPFEGLAPALARRLGEVMASLKTRRALDPDRRIERGACRRPAFARVPHRAWRGGAGVNAVRRVLSQGGRGVAPAPAVPQLGKLFDAVAHFLTRKAQLLELLQVEPVFRAGAEPMPEAQGGIGRYAALAVDDPGHTVHGHVELARQLGSRDAELF